MNAQIEKSEKNGLSGVKKILPLIVPYLGLIFVVVLFSILTNGRLLSANNLKIVFNQFFPTLLCSIGATFYWAHGSLDISISAAMGCAALVAGNMLNKFVSPEGTVTAVGIILAILGAILVCELFAIVNGLLATVCGLSAFLATICTMFIGNGILSYFTLKEIIYIGPKTDTIDSVPVKLIVAVVVIIISYILFEYTFIGKNNIIIGGNIKAARFSGIHIHRDRILAFVVAGVLVGLAAFFSVTRLRSVTNTFGSGMQFNVMISMTFGGMIVGGGKNSRISNGVIGAITYTLLANGLQIAGVPTDYVTLIKGIIFIIVIGLTFKKSKDGLLPA